MKPRCAPAACPRRIVRDVGLDIAFPTALLSAFVAALEAGGWSFASLRRDQARRGARAALPKLMAVTAHALGVRTPLGPRLAARAPVFRAITRLARFMPVDFEAYMRSHFTKVGDQMHHSLRDYATRRARRVDRCQRDRRAGDSACRPEPESLKVSRPSRRSSRAASNAQPRPAVGASRHRGWRPMRCEDRAREPRRGARRRELPSPLSAMATVTQPGSPDATRTDSALPGCAPAERAHTETSCTTSSASVPAAPRASGASPRSNSSSTSDAT